MESFDGLTLTQLGVDVLEKGQPIWVSLNTILDHIAAKDSGSAFGPESVESHQNFDPEHPTAEFARRTVWKNTQSDYTLDVVFSPSISRRSSSTNLASMAGTQVVFSNGKQICAKMIVTTWAASQRERYFTLTFTKADPVIDSKASNQALQPNPISPSTDTVALASGQPDQKSSPRPPVLSLSSQQWAFLPSGPPGIDANNESTLFQKIMKMKDALIDNTTMPIVGIWKDGSVAYPNHAARTLFGKETPESRTFYFNDLITGWTIWDEDFTRQLDVEEYPVKILLDTMTPFEGKRIGIIRENDKRLVFDVLGEVIYDTSTNEPLGGIVSYRDVTKMVEDITRYRKADDEKFRTICNAMPQLVWTSRADGFLEFFNQQWYDYTGLTPNVCHGYWVENVIHPEDVAHSFAEWQKSLETGEPLQIEYRCRDKHGNYRWFLCRARPLRATPDGPITTWFGTSTDVHSAVVNNKITERTKEQLKSVMAHARATLFTVDMNQNVTMLEGGLVGNGISARKENGVSWYIGRNVYTVFGEIIGQLPDGKQPTFLHPIEGVLAGREIDQVEEHDINGRWYRTRFVPILSSDTVNGPEIEGAIGVIMDVTEHYAAIEAETKRRHQAMANEAAANEATRLKSQFLANMSHEFRTPLQWVIGYTDILMSTTMNKEQESLVGTIRNSATILLTLINDILDFSKIESGKMALDETDFQLSSVLTAATEMRLFEAKKKKIKFYIDYADGVNELNLVGDCNRLRQVLNNILDNSMKFTREGFVAFEVHIEEQTDEDITLKFVVCDSGIGIHPSKIDHIYEPFLQGDPSTAREFGGTGLGLSICKSFLDLMHGRIDIKSPPGSGTTATVCIPFRKIVAPAACPLSDAPVCDNSAIDSDCEEDVNETLTGNDNVPRLRSNIDGSEDASSKKRPSTRTHSTVSSRPSLPPRERINILLVEDNRVNARLMQKLLDKMKFTMSVHMWNGQEGLEYVEQAYNGDKAKPDVILMDCQMPVMDGYECAEALRNSEKLRDYVADVPIIAVTASAVAGDRERCMASGMNDYLLKPITQSVLERTIMQHLTLMKLSKPSLNVPAPEPLQKSPTVHEDQAFSMNDISESVTVGSATVTASCPISTVETKAFVDIKTTTALNREKRPPAVTSLSSMSMSSIEAVPTPQTLSTYSDTASGSSESPPPA
ncbi:hypothetical protein TD95_004313 [Thielaviopsis punctulata]|uniref:Histidine kinase n=1 Tax=Thielaviopsis punctulata TaxID=72032 RepID=A0A0F4ZH39_9PEZI|nr:hypothetical protein TD95_004313 [Thielaviopsis punctulata]